MIHQSKQMAAQNYCHFYERFPTGDFAETLLSGGVDASLGDAFETRHGNSVFRVFIYSSRSPDNVLLSDGKPEIM